MADTTVTPADLLTGIRFIFFAAFVAVSDNMLEAMMTQHRESL
jgi:hypothetical protein